MCLPRLDPAAGRPAHSPTGGTCTPEADCARIGFRRDGSPSRWKTSSVRRARCRGPAGLLPSRTSPGPDECRALKQVIEVKLQEESLPARLAEGTFSPCLQRFEAAHP